MKSIKSASVLLGTLAIATISNAQERPNVVFILADDLGYGDLGCYGQNIIKTPNIDSLAKRGMKFTDFYAGCTVSAPSRASLMTGMHTGHTKIRGNKEILPEGQEPMADLPTIASVFKSAGYTTGIFGKWGLGYPNSGAEPLDRGFDKFFGYNCQREAHYYYPAHLYSDRNKYNIDKNKDNARQVYAPDLIQKNAESFIENAVKDKKPFFAYLTYTLPHAELNLPHDAVYEMYEGKVIPKPWDGGGYPPTPDARRSFAAMITKLDNYVGEIVELLEKLGVADNTIIIFTSDNGPHLEGGADPDYFNSNGALRGYKRDLYEGGIREPMIAVWPNKIQSGSINHSPAAFWDFLPTFENILTGKNTIQTDGVSLLENWLGDKNSDNMLNKRPLYWEFHAYGGKQAIREGQWKLVVNGVDTNNPSVELYNLYRDIREENNLASEYPDIVNSLMSKMRDMRTTSSIFPFKNETLKDCHNN